MKFNMELRSSTRNNEDKFDMLSELNKETNEEEVMRFYLKYITKFLMSYGYWKYYGVTLHEFQIIFFFVIAFLIKLDNLILVVGNGTLTFS